MQWKKFSATLWAALMLALITLTLASSAWAHRPYKILHKFQNKEGDGYVSFAGLVFDGAGHLYGTTYWGFNAYGTVFQLVPNPDGSWTENLLHSFAGTDGENPMAGVIFDATGNLYGTTAYGGANGNNGTVFKLVPNPDGSWTESVLHSFGGSDGESPNAGVIFDAAGNLYGTTSSGGANGYGIVFKLTPKPDGSWTESVLHSFAHRDGAFPCAGLIFDGAGNLYGTTTRGGAHDFGIVFKLTPNPDGSWTESVIHRFEGSDGSNPLAGLIFDTAGNLYGTTAGGGAHGFGTVFKLTHNADGSWKRSTLHAFNGKSGAEPEAGLIFDGAGNLYGTTIRGGAYNYGVVFKLTPNPDGTWKRSSLHNFNRLLGADPGAGLIFDGAGNLYGTTINGGKRDNGRDNGVVFRITP